MGGADAGVAGVARGGNGGGSALLGVVVVVVKFFTAAASALMKALFTSSVGLILCWLLLLLFRFGNGGGVSLFPFGDFGLFSNNSLRGGGGELGNGGGVSWRTWWGDWLLDGGVDGDCSCKREKKTYVGGVSF